MKVPHTWLEPHKVVEMRSHAIRCAVDSLCENAPCRTILARAAAFENYIIAGEWKEREEKS